MRPYRDSDRPALERFLRQHVATSMFPLGNLLGGGLATEAWVVEGPKGLTGYLGRATNGNLMPQWPTGDWQQAVPFLVGQTVAGLVGPPDQVRGLVEILGLGHCAVLKSETEPGFSLSLNALRLPDCTGLTLRGVQPFDADLLTEWRLAYNLELGAVTADMAPQISRDEALRMIATASHCLLFRGTAPVAMAGINARIPGVVQIGGVYTPPDFRSQGFARAAVALMLEGLRSTGTDLALLFAASNTAVRAYRAIGFEPSHSFSIHLLAKPELIQPCP